MFKSEFKNFLNKLILIKNYSIQRNLSIDLTQRLKGKTAIVTASTEGIGFAIAKRLGLEGAKVVISSRKQTNVDQALNELKKLNINVDGLVCHVGKEQDRKNLVNHVLKSGPIDILVSNAAVNPIMSRLIDTPSESWDKIFDVNVKSAFEITKEIVPHMEKQKSGSIVYISSVAGYQTMPLIGCYSVSKTALLGLSRALAIELAASNIRVNCVAPGIIKTKFSESLTSMEGLNLYIPLQRMGEPDEISGIVSYLVSEDASYVTGECFALTGGLFSRI